MMDPELAVIGYVSKDIIRKQGEPVIKKIGGRAYYGGLAAAELRAKVMVFNKTSRSDSDLLKPFDHENILLVNFETKLTPEYENIFPTNDPDQRIFKGKHDDFQFTIKRLKPYENQLRTCKFIMISTESYNSVPLDAFKYLHDLNPNIALEADFYLKELENDGNYSKPKLDHLLQVLRFVRIIAISEEDLIHIQDDRSVKDFVKDICDKGPKEILISRGSKGSYLYADETLTEVQAKKIKCVDATGAGDTFLASYLRARIISNNLKKCADFASRATEIKIQSHTALKVSEDQYRSLMEVLK